MSALSVSTLALSPCKLSSSHGFVCKSREVNLKRGFFHCKASNAEHMSDSEASRRKFILESAVVASFLSCGAMAVAEEEKETYSLFKNEVDEFSFLIPSSWEKGEGKVGFKTVLAFYPPGEAGSANVNVLLTNLGADYTSMGSFGTVDAFAETLVNGQDRSWKRPPGQAVKLVSAKSAGGIYFVEYTVQKVGEPKRHLLSAVGAYDNGVYNRLYTLTGQFWEEDSSKYKDQINKAIYSFKLTGKK